jgi:ABC-type phosphate transport system substrate-binding protein
MRILKIGVALLALLLSAPALAEDGFKVIANLEVSSDGLTRAQLSDIFLKRATTWPGGARVVPADLAEELPAFNAFCQAIHNKPGSLIRNFWKRVAASGQDTPPTVRGSDEEMLAFVRTTRGAVGYVSAGASTAGVKTIRVGN